MSALAIDLDGALGDTRPLWSAFVADLARRFRAIAELSPEELPADRVEAAAMLDDWASEGVGDWRLQLERFAADNAPVHLRPGPSAGQIVRALVRAGVEIGVFTDAPDELARVALAHLGVAGRIARVETGAGALERLLEALGPATPVARDRRGLEELADRLLA